MAKSDAGTSSGSARGDKYQVFLSFHDRDTRKEFTSVLYRDLRKTGIHAFMNNEKFRVGKEIGGALLRAIDDSRIYIPIFSQNYASSKWCLRELAKMMDNTTTNSEEKKMLPIFYNVEPKDVNLETSLYKTAIQKHKREHKEEFSREVESWEEALKKVDNIKGWVRQKYERQAELVDSVVEEVLQELKITYKSVTKDIVGLDDRVDEVLGKLDVNRSDEVRLLGLHGMGGIGKTTLAWVVYNKLSSCFRKCCAFIYDIPEMSKKKGLVWLQEKLLKEIDSSSAAENIYDVDSGRERIEATLGSKKVLIVLDDIDEKKQIENLIGRRWLHLGTRIIITTRKRSVLEMNSDQAIQLLPYEMKEMKSDYALQLFKTHAFGGGSLTKDFDGLSIDIVKNVKSLPLTLEVIGSLLYGKDKATWKETLHKLKEIPDDNVQKQLMISYDNLNDRQRNIFLDVVCFFINEDMTNPIYMWTDYKFYPNLEINVLVNMSLIKIWDNKFWMHDQVRDLGWEIVRQQNLTNLEKRIRLWTSEEVLDFVRTEESKEDVGALDQQGMSFGIFSSHREIGRFKNLRFLRLSKTMHGHLHISRQKLRWISLPKLRWISWCLPFSNVPTLRSEKLVVLELFDINLINDSRVQGLIKIATKLKNLTLVKCDRITKTPDLSKCLELERLSFRNCKRLMEIDSSIGRLKCLLDLNITDCGRLERVPYEIGGLVKLERFSLQKCSRVSGLPISIGDLASLKKLDLSYTGITSLPGSIGSLKCLLDLNISYCWLIERVPDEIGGLVKLERFSLQKCLRLSGLPPSIGGLASLRKFDLSYTGITSLPKSVGKLRCLSDLNLKYSEITEIPDKIEGLVELRHLDLQDTKIKQLSHFIGKLKSLCTLNLSRFQLAKLSSNRWELPEAIGKLEKLEELYLGRREELVGEIPDEIGHLSSLRVLDLCWTRINRVPGTINMLSHLSTLDLTRCDEITELPELPVSLVKLHVHSGSLQVVRNLSKLTNLEDLSLSDYSEKRDLPNLKHKCELGWIGRLSKLKMLNLSLLNFTALSPELGLLSLLEYLTLSGLDLQPLKQLPPSLVHLDVENFSSTGSPLSNLKVLSNLTLHCSRLQEVQLNGLSQLHLLLLKKCDLRSVSIPSSLRILSFIYCPNMMEIQFPGMSASLEQLSIDSCESIGRIVLCGEGGSLEALDQSKSPSSESTDCSLRVLLLPNALKKLNKIQLRHCRNLLEIQVIGTLLSLQEISIQSCDAMENFSGVSNLKNLHCLSIYGCSKLQVVEGLDELEFLTRLSVNNCPSLETLLDISNSKIPDNCKIQVSQCSKSLNYSLGWWRKFKNCKEKAKIKGNAEEPDAELQLQLHPSASSRDHEINEEPPIDNVKEGTPLGNQNQTRQQDSNPLSISPLSSTELQLQLHPSASSRDHEINEEPPIDDVREGTPPGNQNQTREQDSNPQSNSPLSSTGLQLQFHPSASSQDHEINEVPPIDNVREGTPPGNQNQTREQDSNPSSLD